MEHRSVFKGQIIALSISDFGPSVGGVTFVRRPELSGSDVILPDGLLSRVENHTLGIARQADVLRAHGQHLKRGLLLYGPPGTGKTHTVRYLLSQSEGTTAVLLSGGSLARISEAAKTARALAPSIVVLEDCDLIAEDRSFGHGPQPLLFEVLDAMDGLDNDSDVAFVLTTNRVDMLERALAQRPGRVDLAVESRSRPSMSARNCCACTRAGLPFHRRRSSPPRHEPRAPRPRSPRSWSGAPWLPRHWPARTPPMRTSPLPWTSSWPTAKLSPVKDIEEAATEIAVLWLDVDPHDVRVHVALRLPEAVAKMWQDGEAREDAAREMVKGAAVLKRAAVHELGAGGVTLSDAGILLGLSTQRVHQLSKLWSARTADRRSWNLHRDPEGSAVADQPVKARTRTEYHSAGGRRGQIPDTNAVTEEYERSVRIAPVTHPDDTVETRFVGSFGPTDCP
ncbi:ATP-binding protein [Arthrobacter sp. A5]|uniref:ATP-binding protein n=1 Tax=Arthrobacter sp. A5 TaxID=576926 RepID=UPI003DA87081